MLDYIYLAVNILIAFVIFYQFKRFLFADKVILNVTKTKWNREISYEKSERPPDNLNGWILIFQSKQIKPGQVEQAGVFGNDLLIFRSSSGKIHVIDAYCPHMGTYLPVGGKVVGESVRCPFHGWTFNGKGECTHVPGLDYTNLPKVNVKPWQSFEMNGLIMVWYHSNNEPAQWLPLKNKELDGLQLASSWQFTSGGHFKETLLNSIDYTHFDCIHTPAFIVSPISVFQNGFWCRMWTKIQSFSYEHTYERLPEPHRFKCSITPKTYFFGHSIPIDITISSLADGPYLVHFTLTGPLVDLANIRIVTTIIPIQCRRFRVVYHAYSKPTFLAKMAAVLVLRFLSTQVVRDIFLWSGKKTLRKIFFSKLESDLIDLTRWINQFEPENETLEKTI